MDSRDSGGLWLVSLLLCDSLSPRGRSRLVLHAKFLAISGFSNSGGHRGTDCNSASAREIAGPPRSAAAAPASALACFTRARSVGHGKLPASDSWLQPLESLLSTGKGSPRARRGLLPSSAVIPPSLQGRVRSLSRSRIFGSGSVSLAPCPLGFGRVKEGTAASLPATPLGRRGARLYSGPFGITPWRWLESRAGRGA